ncbi:Uncharacterized protein Fot_45423 [Forsythia ovata]|uniref:Uncharacterized protein n=1 Tax=Forsythia ovata TaxID=205694 RepID=A0ABD1R6D9_9LAMI
MPVNFIPYFILDSVYQINNHLYIPLSVYVAFSSMITTNSQDSFGPRAVLCLLLVLLGFHYLNQWTRYKQAPNLGSSLHLLLNTTIFIGFIDLLREKHAVLIFRVMRQDIEFHGSNLILFQVLDRGHFGG